MCSKLSYLCGVFVAPLAPERLRPVREGSAAGWVAEGGPGGPSAYVFNPKIDREDPKWEFFGPIVRGKTMVLV